MPMDTAILGNDLLWTVKTKKIQNLSSWPRYLDFDLPAGFYLSIN